MRWRALLLRRECAGVERALEKDAGGTARQLRGLLALLSTQHLEVARAFGQLDTGWDQGASYSQLVSAGSPAL